MVLHKLIIQYFVTVDDSNIKKHSPEEGTQHVFTANSYRNRLTTFDKFRFKADNNKIYKITEKYHSL